MIHRNPSGSIVSVPDSALIGDRASIGLRAVIGFRAVIGDRAFIGDGASIGVGAVIRDRASIGLRAVIGDGASIGVGAVIRDRAFIGRNADVKSKADILTICSKYNGNIIPMKDGIFIRIGCEVRLADDWLENGEAIATKYNEKLWWAETGKWTLFFLFGEVLKYQKER